MVVIGDDTIYLLRDLRDGSGPQIQRYEVILIQVSASDIHSKGNISIGLRLPKFGVKLSECDTNGARGVWRLIIEGKQCKSESFIDFEERTAHLVEVTGNHEFSVGN